ncbi:hypothetical protein SNL152K_6567 [Streptomyces sp. NL15-2K]|nr:hypothetical protein SNL152K_6567 [Streptomyces sp. NL15-2K]
MTHGRGPHNPHYTPRGYRYSKRPCVRGSWVGSWAGRYSGRPAVRDSASARSSAPGRTPRALRPRGPGPAPGPPCTARGTCAQCRWSQLKAMRRSTVAPTASSRGVETAADVVGGHPQCAGVFSAAMAVFRVRLFEGNGSSWVERVTFAGGAR